MPLQEAQRILFVVNHQAGASDRNWQQEIEAYFKDLPHQIFFILLNEEVDKKAIRQVIEKEAIRTVVAVGGDGTIKLVAEIILHSDVALGIIPAGSANGMAKELKIPSKLADALEVILNTMVTAIDIVRINNKDVCLHLSDVGLNAKLINYFENGNRRGMLGYASVAFKVLMNLKQLSLQVKANGKTYERNAFMAVIANARMYGTGALINPKGNYRDGLFEIILIKKLSVWQVLKIMLRSKKPDQSKIEIIQTKEAEFRVNQPAHFQVDGEKRSKTTHVTARSEPAALRIIAPPSAFTTT
jgi:diacylglycerol kinase (ATP)